MLRVPGALLGGVVIGGLLFLLLRQPSHQAAPPVADVARPTGAAETPERSATIDRASSRPGLVVTVTRAGAPEALARIELARADRSLRTNSVAWHGVGQETTDEAGRAELPAALGRHLVVATGQDGQRAVATVDVSLGDGPTRVELALKPGIPLLGRVIDQVTGRPIAGAQLRADPQAEQTDDAPTLPLAVTGSDSLGRFAFELPGPHWRLEARAEGYLAAVERVEVPGPALELKLERGARLSGEVVDAAGLPVAGATVKVEPSDVPTLTTDAQGRFSILVRHGAVSLHALAPDGRQGLARPLISPGQDTAQVRLVVGPGSLLSGLVRDATGPLPEVDVRILAEPEALEVAAFTTGADGRFEAKGLPNGRYSVRAQRGLGQRASAVGIELPGALPVELVLPAPASLTGEVHDDQGQPVAFASVTLEWPRALGEPPRAARTGADGRFAFDEVLAAEVTVQARWEELVSHRLPTYLAPNGTAAVTLVLSGEGLLIGTVVGRPTPRVLIRGDQPGRGEFANVVDGIFSQRLAPGKYWVLVPHEETFIERKSVVVRAGEQTVVELTVPEPGDGGVLAHRAFRLHDELGSGLSFENAPGGVRVDFLMADCPAAKAGVQLGDLVVAIDGEPTRNALDAFQRVRKPAEDASLELLVRREGRDLPLTVR